jgi:hypothetical protein
MVQMMNFGRLLAIIGGIITFAGSWWLSLYVTGGGQYVYAIGGIMQFSNVIANAATNPLGVDAWVIYLILVAYGFYLLSFIPQLLGGKSRISAFIGSLLPLALGVMIMVYSLSGQLGIIETIMNTFAGDALITTWFPFHYSIGSQFEAIGTYAITFGSFLALISSFIPRPEEY